MNLITHSSAISLFPYSTFVRHCSFPLGFTGKEGKYQTILAKYASRGWHFDQEHMEILQHPEYLLQCQGVGDQRCWFIPWLSWSACQDSDVTFSNTWNMETHRPEDPLCWMYSPVCIWYHLFRMCFEGQPTSYLTVASRHSHHLDLGQAESKDIIRNQWQVVLNSCDIGFTNGRSYSQWLACLVVLHVGECRIDYLSAAMNWREWSRQYAHVTAKVVPLDCRFLGYIVISPTVQR